MNITKSRLPVLLAAFLFLLAAISGIALGEETDVQEIAVSNTPVKGMIQLEKHGPVLTGFTEHQDPFGYLVHTPIYGTGWLEGAVFEVRAVEDIAGKDGTVWFRAGELADTIVTAGEVNQSRLLPLGHYCVAEVSAPDGYVFQSTRYDVVLEAKDHETPVVAIAVTASNDFLPTRITMVKEKETVATQADDEGMVATALVRVPGEGFIFGLYNSEEIRYASGSLPADSLISTAISDKDGNVAFVCSLPSGAYYLKELAGPDGWKISEAQYTVRVPDDGHVSGKELQISLAEPVLNELVHREVRISKTDLTGSDYLPLTTPEIRNAENEVVLKGYTGEDGYLPPFPAVPGDYTYREVLAPEGYELSTATLRFSVLPDGRISGKTTVADDFTRFSIRKENETHQPLAGVEFGLFRKDGSLQAKAVTDEEGLATFEKIPYGEYVIRETRALPGYLKSAVSVPVTVDGTFINPKEPIATLVNCRLEILIRKVDENNAALPGAEFGLYDESGKLVMTAVSDAEGLVRFTGAEYGKYTIREISAPDGYLVSRDVIHITLDDGYANSDTPAATVRNPEKKIMCIKSDTSGNPIPGIEFSLINASTMEIAETAVSDDNGVFVFRKFDYGDWIIRETAAPEGFSLMEDVRFHVGDDWKEPEPILCVNIPNHYEFVKTDSSGNPLEGVTFRLEDEDGNELGTYQSGQDGIVRITDLVPGTYLIREIETLEGYSVTGEVIKVQLDTYYTVPETMRRLVNYTTIQTGVHLAVTIVMWVGLGLMVVSGTLGIIRKCRKGKEHPSGH